MDSEKLQANTKDADFHFWILLQQLTDKYTKGTVENTENEVTTEENYLLLTSGYWNKDSAHAKIQMKKNKLNSCHKQCHTLSDHKI